jgi:hypothetical protein
MAWSAVGVLSIDETPFFKLKFCFSRIKPQLFFKLDFAALSRTGGCLMKDIHFVFFET